MDSFMTDWSQLSHAYGCAEDIPALLDRLETDPDADWNDLWSALCHQGTVYSASFAVLPWLMALATDGDEDTRLDALFLAGAIMAGADQPHGAGAVRQRYATEIAQLLRMANERRRTLHDCTDYLYLLHAIVAFEGVPGGCEALEGLGNGVYAVSCPACATALFIVIGDDGYFSTSGDHVLKDDVTKTPLRPANPESLNGVGRRLHGIALADGQHDAAAAMTYLFGTALCTSCGAAFCVADQVGRA
ncbi:hypothetical protein HS041_28945 [Planomonospora sp. ID67723]|uniref:hypothetical protein n=1 Tax=Planomonospora sp. ID67723 TaxID=2738134 RepID=UPI0018C380A4|nr:hypothetical protein [Planomonospora sp. ID67723]MBG0831749.1 hypothetical protein [Planomonospora sp. ID67723]